MVPKWRHLNSNLRMRILLQEFVVVPKAKFDEAFSGHFRGFEDSEVATRGLGLSRAIWTRDKPAIRAGLTCAKFSVACSRMIATLKKEARSSLLTSDSIDKNSPIKKVGNTSLVLPGGYQG